MILHDIFAEHRDSEKKPGLLSVWCNCEQGTRDRSTHKCCHTVFTKNKPGENWICTKVAAVKCNTPFMKEEGKSSTMYNHADLVRYLTKSIALPVNPRQLRLTLEPILRLHKDVSASWYGRLKQLLEEAIKGGAPSKLTRELPAYIRALEEKGWDVELETITATEMNELVLAHYKKKCQDEGKDFDALDAPKVDPDKKYIRSISIQPPHASEFLSNFPYKVTVADWTHCNTTRHTYQSHCVGFRVVQDGDLHGQVLAAVLFMGNEDRHSWGKLYAISQDNLSEWDVASTIEISDRSKGQKAAAEDVGLDLSSFYDSWHLKQNIIKVCGSGACTHFSNALEANTEAELQTLRDAYPDNLKAYLSELPLDQVYPILNKKLGLRRHGSIVEGENSAFADIVEEHPAYVIGKLVEKIASQASKQKKAAAKAMENRVTVGANVHDKYMKNVAKAVLCTATMDDPNICQVTDASGKQYVSMTELNKPNIGLACTCKLGAAIGIPCHHIIAAARFNGRTVDEYFIEQNTVRGWNNQYASVGGVSSMVPSRADIERHSNLFDDDLAFPPPYKQPVGRPKTAKRQKGVLEAGQRRKKRCPRCRRYCKEVAPLQSDLECNPI